MEATKQRVIAAEQAARWWVLLQENPSPAERAAYVTWLQDANVNVAEILRLSETHAALERFTRWERISAEDLNDHEDLTVELPVGRSADQTEARSLAWAIRSKSLRAAAAMILALLIAQIKVTFLRHQSSPPVGKASTTTFPVNH